MSDTKYKNYRNVHLMFKGIIDINEFWMVIIDHLRSKMYEVNETKVKHKGGPPESIEYGLRAWRNVSTYARYIMNVNVIVWDMVDVVVVKDGVKKKLKKCRFLVNVSGDLELDYANRFERSAFSKAVRDFLNQKILIWKILVYWGDQLDYKVQELADVMKEYMKMETRGSSFSDMW